MAELELQGLAQETAELLIEGKLNPLAQPLMLDIHGKVNDLDLPPLSPYSVKYAGYGIERGKLNVDVNYVINADGRLTATNKIVLRQLAFGDRVDGGGSLPVKLAVALLADRNGVINVDLPVSGSINDPQFSIAGLVWRALGNLIVRAVTSPFTLLSSAFGGGAGTPQSSAIDFTPGAKWLEAPARQNLDKVAQAMRDKPQLQLTLVGLANRDAEAVEFQRVELAKRVEATARGDAPPPGDEASRVWMPPTLLTGAAYEDALRTLYRRSNVDKPRNFIGMARTLPVADMEKLLMADIPASPAVLQQVAAERAMAVRAYLLAQGVPASRLFLGASRNVEQGAEHWQPRVELQLGVN